MKRIALFAAVCGVALGAGAFEKIAQADHWDFSSHFDVETKDGICDIIDHIRLTGADTLAWRVNGGSSPRYWSREEPTLDMMPPFNPLRIPDGRAVQGHIRLYGGGAGVDAYKFAMEELGRRKLGRCAYWPYEENHHFTSKVGAWNLDHPQFWCVNPKGKPWMGRCSIAFPEVRAHKLRLLDEILAYGPDSIYIEAWRTGAWTVADEYVKPNLDAWRAKYPGEEIPSPDDPRWIALIAETQHAFFADVRKHLDATGRKVRFLFGIYGVSKDGDPLWTKKAIDWRRLVREGIIDGVVIASVKPDPTRPLESTRELYEMVAKDKGSCQLFCPVSAYTFQGCGIANYAEWLGVSKEEATRKLLELAHAVKADGILMECVDYRNYTPEMCEVLRQDTPQAAPLDISGDRARHVVVAQGTPETYNGHATVARTKSGKLITVWTIGHGGPCGPAAESLDGGKTWTRIDERFPAEWKTTKNCPAIFALEGKDGKERLFVFAVGRMDKVNNRGVEMRHCVSEDDGLTWRMLPSAIPVTCVMPLTTVIRCADGSYLGMYNDRWPERKKKWNRVFQIRSTDGGFTWSPGELVAESEKMNLCEPFLLRSDDGKELCAILRDNCRDALSKLVFSRDEGKTWTAPVDSAPALSGHRHAGVKDSTGRWTIVFRDFEPQSPFGHNYCAWRGTYADIVARRPGEKIKLLDNCSKRKADCGYGACVLMPGDTVFALTYIQYNPDPEKHSIVGVWLPK